MAQWLELCTSTAESMGSIPGQETQDPTYHVVQQKTNGWTKQKHWAKDQSSG